MFFMINMLVHIIILIVILIVIFILCTIYIHYTSCYDSIICGIECVERNVKQGGDERQQQQEEEAAQVAQRTRILAG